jgi:hypothetical protein
MTKGNDCQVLVYEWANLRRIFNETEEVEKDEDIYLALIKTQNLLINILTNVKLLPLTYARLNVKV